MEKQEYSPKKRGKTEVVVAVEEQGERLQAGQPFERTQELDLDGARSTFRIITIDGGKTLNAELPMPRLCCLMYVCLCVRVKVAGIT
jgi:hypothetical protein